MIKKILTYIKTFFCKKTIADNKSLQEYKDMTYGMSYKYHTNNTISIDIVLNKINEDNQLKQSESFAQFLYHVTQPSFRQTILDNIKIHSQTPEDVLFYQNIIFNITMLELYKNNKESLKRKDNEPVIRPLSVFNEPN